MLIKYAFPVNRELLDKTRHDKWFTRLDLTNGFNFIGVAAGHEWKTAFRHKEGLFEYTVMPFGFTKAPATLQEMPDTIFKDEECCVGYMDDILIYGAETEAEHQSHVEKIPQLCINYGLAVNLTKSEIHVHQTILLSHTVNGRQVQRTLPNSKPCPSDQYPLKWEKFKCS